jgi:hypothetical protein
MHKDAVHRIKNRINKLSEIDYKLRENNEETGHDIMSQSHGSPFVSG